MQEYAINNITYMCLLLVYCHHFQLSSFCNWPSSGVCPVYNIPSLGVKGTSSVLWSSANFCSIFQTMHYTSPVALQHWKTNKLVWTWKDDWPPWRTSTYKRPPTQEGNYLVWLVANSIYVHDLWHCHPVSRVYSDSGNIIDDSNFICCIYVGIFPT